MNSSPLRWKALNVLGSCSELIDQLAASIVRNGRGVIIQKSVSKEHLLPKISVTTQGAISRRVHRYKLALRNRQVARGRREDGGLLPMA